jgi:hypothetical protein
MRQLHENCCCGNAGGDYCGTGTGKEVTKEFTQLLQFEAGRHY